MDPPPFDPAAGGSYATPFSRAGSGDAFAETEALLAASPAVLEQRLAAPGACSLSPALWHPLPDRIDDDDCAFAPCLAIKTEHQTLQLQHPPLGWPSPPLAPGDMDQCPCLLDSPPSAGALLSSYSYACSPSSPGTCWSPPPPLLPPPAAAAAPPARHGAGPLVQADDFAALCTPPSAKALPLYGFSPLPGAAFAAEALSPEELLLATPCPSLMTPKAESPPNALSDVPELDLEAARPMDAKLDEPYAKLIYRALMSRPDHAMTLQEMYQWFRDNTNKALTEKGGWQNSIRHNLSMNAAFTKRQRKDDGFVADDPKRASQWVLEDWAVRYGVQSTTRYRKGNSRRRPAGRVGASPAQHSAKRAVSGRKGGCAARDSRLRDRGCFGRAVPRSAGPELGFGALPDEALGLAPDGLADALMPSPGPCAGYRGPAFAYGLADAALGFPGSPARFMEPPMPDGLYDWGDGCL